MKYFPFKNWSKISLWVSPNLLLLICNNLKPNTHVKMRAEKGPKIIDLFIGLSLKIPCDMSQKKRLQNVVFIYFFFLHLCVVTTYRYMILGHKNSFLMLFLILLGIETFHILWHFYYLIHDFAHIFSSYLVIWEICDSTITEINVNDHFFHI